MTEHCETSHRHIADLVGNGRSHRGVLLQLIALMAFHAGPAQAASGKPPRWVAVQYAEAVSLFRKARFPEAYGRFVAVAELGHAPAAAHALMMCENGQELFGSHFDCAPGEIETWALQSGGSPREALRRIYPGLVEAGVASRARR